jgi:cell division protein FtsI (penicillin-binding protein 3)
VPRFRTFEQNDSRQIEKRVFLVGALMALALGVLMCRAMFFQLEDNQKIEQVALRQYRTAVHESTKRGRVLDAKGRELAVDLKVDSVFANPHEIVDPVLVAENLSKILDVDRGNLLDKFSANRKFVWVKRLITEDQAKKIEALGIKGIYMMRESSRFYPGKTLASSVLGAVGFDSAPLGGVELTYDKTLSTRSRVDDFRRDARGHLYLSPTDEQKTDVYDIELTIDRTLQYIAEKELEDGVKSSRSKSGAALVVDVNSGAVLAMANYPGFDPNDYSKYSLSSWTNRAIVEPYEPGSTFKAIIVAAALDAGVVTQKDMFDCEMGKIQIGDHIVKDAHAHGDLSVADIIKVSSNIGAYKVEQKLGRGETYNAIEAFGFGKESGIDLPGESAGLLSPYKKWSELQFATIAFGQGIAATPMQMAMAFAAIANGGELLRPYVVKRVIDQSGQVVFKGEKKLIATPIKAATASLMTKLLERVVGAGGTGTLAASLEYRIAGKTGTAQKANPRTGGYMKGKYLSSFIGFAPADNPKIAIYVAMDEPSGSIYYGGQVAAPVFKNIAEATLHYLKVPTNTIEASADVLRQLPPPRSVDDAVDISKVDEIPSASVEDKNFSREGDAGWKIPDLTGLTMREILSASKGVDVHWQFEGSGVAVSQSAVPGDMLKSGDVCKVVFKSLM